jgi:putative aminopeptidase FrvX
MKKLLSGLCRGFGWLLLLSAGRPTLGQTLHFDLVGKDVVQQRVEDVPRKNSDRELRIKQLFHEVGCASTISEQPVKRSRLPNVVCILPSESDEAIIVGAHYDQISPAQGIIDNWSGASLLASLYQGLKSEKRHHTFLFIAFTDEELGLVGSEFYAGHMSREEVARTRAMVNLDSLGLSPTKVWVHRADPELVAALLTVAGAMKLPVSEVDVERVGSADSESFASRHIRRITIHSVTQETFRVLHSSRDTVKELNFDDYYDSYHLLSGFLAYLDQRLVSGAAKPEERGTK